MKYNEGTKYKHIFKLTTGEVPLIKKRTNATIKAKQCKFKLLLHVMYLINFKNDFS